MKSIPTTYDGVKFRSRLEARYAQFFDNHGIGWEYEIEGIDLGGKWYLPDFWLPDSRTFLEVKGPIKARCDLVELAQDLIDEETSDHCSSDHIIFVVADECGHMRLGNDPVSEMYWAKCCECLCWYPLYFDGGWNCRACGFYDGDQTYSQMIERVRLPQMQWRSAA